MRSCFAVQKAGLGMGPAWLPGFLVLLLLAAPVSAQKSRQSETVASLLGISIGTNLGEARTKLAQIGTGSGRVTRDGGRKEAWTLKESDYADGLLPQIFQAKQLSRKSGIPTNAGSEQSTHAEAVNKSDKDQ